MAASNDELAQWAASFLAVVSEVEPILRPTREPTLEPAIAPTIEPAFTSDIAFDSYTNITPAARVLLRAVDAGGVPAFMTGAIKQIALDNDIALSALSTPNDVVDALRARCMTSTTPGATNFE